MNLNPKEESALKTLSRWISQFCYNHPNFGIPELIKYIAVGNVVVFVGDIVTQGMLSWFISFYPEQIFHGQIWRLITFVFAPLPVGGESMLAQTIFGRTFLFALTTFFYYWIGTSLERQWGTTRFTVFYGLGVLFNIIVGIVIYLSLPSQATGAQFGLYIETANMYYVNMSLFFSFATLFPDMQVNLYGIIPLKVKWLALIDLVFFGYAIFKGGKVKFNQIMAGLFGSIAIGYSFSAFLRLEASGVGRAYLLLPFILSFACDTFAFFAGLTLGKHKLAPKVSPKKTVEGSIGGLAGNVLCGLVFAWVMNRWFSGDVPYGAMAVLALFCGAVAQVGDLSFSLIKREFGVKDYGKIFFAHGGVLDRFDSVLFVAPALAALMQFLNVT